MAHSDSYTEATPTDSTLSTSIDDEIVKSRRMYRERFAIDHKVSSSDDGSDVYGVHKKVTFEARISTPTEPTNSIATFYLKTGDYDAELRFVDERDVDNLIIMVGEVKMILGATVPAGWLGLNGDTIGSAASGATKAHANYEDLYKYLWNELADAEFPINGGRGASAAADWTANKYGTMPDARSRVPIGAGEGAGLTARTKGATGGAETQDVEHTHDAGTLSVPAHNHQWYNNLPSGVSADQSYNSGGTAVDLPLAAQSKSSGTPFVRRTADESSGPALDDCYTDNEAAATPTGSVANGGSTTQDVMNPWIALTMIIKY